MNIQSINTNNNPIQVQKRSHQVDYKESFSKALENLKSGKPADYDKESIEGQNTQTLMQVMSDGSVLITVYDEDGHIISQNKSRAAKTDPNAQIIGTEVESNSLGLDELTMEGNINLANLQ